MGVIGSRDFHVILRRASPAQDDTVSRRGRITQMSLRALGVVSLLAGFAVAWALGAALRFGGASGPAALMAAAGTLAVFLLPCLIAFRWARRHAAGIRELAERSRRLAGGDLEPPLSRPPVDGELSDVARAIEQIRATLVRERGAAEEHRAAMTGIVASLREGLIGVRADGRVAVANRRVAEMFGSGDDLVGRSILEVVRKRSVAAALEGALRGDASTHRTTFGAGADERQMEVRAFPVETAAEIAAVALFIDVTEIERLQRIRKDFLDDFSHEVRTPLAGLRSAAETLEQGGLAPASEQQLRHVMQRQIARIERLVTDLSELNQIESGELILARERVNVRQVLEDLCDEFRRRNADVRFSLTGDRTIAFIDPSRAQQIFTNLLDNAWRHGAGAGEIEVEVGVDDGEAVVRVSDRGPGIPPHELERIFNRFYRIDRSRSQPGTGLGLAIAKHLAAAHGGSIRAFNRAGGGATFEVRLPAG